MKLIFAIIFCILIISFWHQNELPTAEALLPILNNEPIQVKHIKQPFTINFDEQSYSIHPKYKYELYGLVVSYKIHNSKTGVHARWGDSLNVADVCVVWSNNAFNSWLNKIHFHNREWTCYFQAPNYEILNSFNKNQISNNHLITENKFLRDRITTLRIGDQIKLTGWLSSYKTSKGLYRDTSINREDTGNGACETIYVNDLEILRTHTSIWKKIMYLSLILLVCITVKYFTSPFKSSI